MVVNIINHIQIIYDYIVLRIYIHIYIAIYYITYSYITQLPQLLQHLAR